MAMYIFQELAAVFKAFWPVLAVAAAIDTSVGLTALGVWAWKKRKAKTEKALDKVSSETP